MANEDTKGMKDVSDLPVHDIIAKENTIASFYSKNMPGFDYEKIIDDLVSGNPDKLAEIQAKILDEVAAANVDEFGNMKYKMN